MTRGATEVDAMFSKYFTPIVTVAFLGKAASASGPKLGDADFFEAVRAELDFSGDRIHVSLFDDFIDPRFGPDAWIRVFTMKAETMELFAYTTDTEGHTLDTAIAATDNRGAELIINGALCNYKCQNIVNGLPINTPDWIPRGRMRCQSRRLVW